VIVSILEINLYGFRSEGTDGDLVFARRLAAGCYYQYGDSDKNDSFHGYGLLSREYTENPPDEKINPTESTKNHALF